MIGKSGAWLFRSVILLSLCLVTVSPLWAGPKIIRIAAMGDIMLGTENLLPEDEAASAFSEVRPYLKDRQVVIGNLEGPLTDRGTPSKTVVEGLSYVFRTPPHYVDRLKEAGFTIMSLANNHAGDYGPAGYEQTREVLDGAGILHTGAPDQWARQRVGQTTVSVLGLAPNSGCQDINDIPAAVELVKAEAEKPDTLVIVTFHGGGEGGGYIYVPQRAESFLGESRGDVRKLSHDLIDAGAHLIIGHGPHVPRGLEIYKDRLIAYSLGNFVTGRGINVSGYGGLAPLLLVELSAKGDLVGGRVVSFRQSEAGRAGLDDKGEAAQLMHALSFYDFDRPALGADGVIAHSEKEALLLAASSPKPARPQALAKARKKVEDELLKTAQAEKPEVKKIKSPRKAKENKAPTRYEWDVYSGS